MNTALNRTTVFQGTNKSGGAVALGDVVILGSATAKSFTTTTTGAFKNAVIAVVIEPNGIADNATGAIATAGWVPKVNLNAAAALYDLIKTHTVAKQGASHAAPPAAGDFAIALQATATPEAILFGSPEQGGGSSLTVEEVDGAPTVASVVKIKVSNGTLTDNGAGVVTVTTGGGAGGAESWHPFLL